MRGSYSHSASSQAAQEKLGQREIFGAGNLDVIGMAFHQTGRMAYTLHGLGLVGNDPSLTHPACAGNR